MTLLETTSKYRCDSENSAKDLMESFREEAKQKGFILKKNGYEHKQKKSKGEIIDEAWIVTTVKVFGGIWE